MKQALGWAWYPLLALLAVASVMLAHRVYVAYHCAGGLYCGCPTVTGCNNE